MPKQVNLRLPVEVLAEVEELRRRGAGPPVPRDRYIRAMVQRHVDLAEPDVDFDARRYVEDAESPSKRALRDRLYRALDDGRGEVPRMEFWEHVLLDALGIGGDG